jgi:adenylate cyclase
MVGLTEEWRRTLDAKLGFGVGIDHGYATTGRIGFEGRFDYAAIGPPTNRAARLCARAADRQILITQRVYAAVETLVEAELIGDVELRGFHEPARVYNVLGLKQAPGSG